MTLPQSRSRPSMETLREHAELLATKTLLAKREIEWRAQVLAKAWLEANPEAPCETCKGDPAVCATIPGLRHCEAANRQAAQSESAFNKACPFCNPAAAMGRPENTRAETYHINACSCGFPNTPCTRTQTDCPNRMPR